jgi:hypothetical protein
MFQRIYCLHLQDREKSGVIWQKETRAAAMGEPMEAA